jgi:mRNA interferase MazF
MDRLKRGDIVVVVLSGDYGKPRPALVVQSDPFNDDWPSVTLAPLTTTPANAPFARLTVDPSAENGLRSVSQIMIDKLQTVPKERVRATIGRLEDEHLQRVSRALMLWLGLAA